MLKNAHIPSYLLCEPFAQKGLVADLFPPDESGSKLLSKTASMVLVVQRSSSCHDNRPTEGTRRVSCSPEDLPLAAGAFDLALAMAPGNIADGDMLETVVRSARALLNPSGVLAVMIPNRDSVGLDGKRASDFPSFIEFERSLRRHFPHVHIFASQPLHGAVLAPLGRRDPQEGPLLDNRMLPEDGEIPSHFLALCSPRYQRPADTTIAQLPFTSLADDVRSRIEKLEGTIALLRRENETKSREVELLSSKTDSLRTQLTALELASVDSTSLEQEIADLKEQLERREKIISELESVQKKQALEHSERLETLHELRSNERRLEQQLEELTRLNQICKKDRDEADQSRLEMISRSRELDNQLKAKQREVDDRVEQVAGVEAELSALHKEVTHQRRDLLAAREQVRRLNMQLSQTEESTADLESLEAEIDRIRKHAAAERERLQARLKEEHDQLLEVVPQKEAADKEILRLETALTEERQKVEAITRSLASAKKAAVRADDKIVALELERDARLEAEEKTARSNEDLARALQESRDEVQRQSHGIALLKGRAQESEQRAAALQEKLAQLHQTLSQTEGELSKERALSSRVETLEEALGAAREEARRTKDELDRIRPDASSAATARRRALTAESSIYEMENLNKKLEAKHRELEVERREIESRHKDLEAEHQKLEAEYQKLEAEHRKLEAVHQKLGSDLPKLQGGAKELSDKNADLAARNEDLASLADGLVREKESLEAKITALEAEFKESSNRVMELDADLSSAMEALAESEEGAEVRVKSMGDRIREMKSEIARLTEENETELLLVREDLESELRYANTQLEARQSELWELREEVVRLKATVAASSASADKEGTSTEVQRTLAEQENTILQLSEERDRLRETNEKQARSLETRKKNLKILATLLRKERSGKPGSLPEIPGQDQGQLSLEREREIAALIDEASGEVAIGEEVLPFDPLDEDSPTGRFHRKSVLEQSSEDDEVDQVMDSVVTPARPDRGPEPKKRS